MKPNIAVIGVVVAAALASGAAAAEQAQPEGASDGRVVSAVPRYTGATISTSPAAGKSHDIRMSRLIGMPIDDSRGRHVGEVKDLIVDTSDGRARYAVLDVGGFLGIGEHRTAVPLDRVRASLEHGHVVIDMTAEELRRFPSYPPDEEPDWNDRAFHARVEGTVPSPAGVPTYGHRFRSADKLLHADLRDGLGRDVGDLEDIVMDLDSGDVRYGVARFDPLWAPHPRLVVLRPEQVSIRADDDDLTIRATQAELRRAPTFEPRRMLASNR